MVFVSPYWKKPVFLVNSPKFGENPVSLKKHTKTGKKKCLFPPTNLKQIQKNQKTPFQGRKVFPNKKQKARGEAPPGLSGTTG